MGAQMFCDVVARAASSGKPLIVFLVALSHTIEGMLVHVVYCGANWCQTRE